MKQIKFIIVLLTLAALAAMCSVRAQIYSITSANIASALTTAGLSLDLLNNHIAQVGVPFTVTTPQGAQSWLITETNNLYTISTYGVHGSATFTPPTSAAEFIAQGQGWVGQNNPANIDYYSTNGEIELKLGVQYLQHSGQAVFSLGAEKWSLFGQPNVGIGVGILEGNNNGSSGTAGYYGSLDYRKPIGDVCVYGGALFGYDNWSKEAFAGAHAGLEYRQSKHLGEFIDVAAVYENGKGSDTPFLIGGGITTSF